MNSNSYIRVSKNSNKKQNSTEENKIDNNENKEGEQKKENPKKKLFAALNNINDEINVAIDSKDKLVNSKLNLDCFINKQSSVSSSRTKSPEKFINCRKDINKFISPPMSKEEEFKRFIKTETDNDKRNLRKINKSINNDVNQNIKTDPKKLEKFINTSQSSIISKDKNSENTINKKSHKKSFPNIVYINNSEKENELNNNSNVDRNKKLTLHNLNTEDKILLKDMEAKNALLVTDISSLNKKSITNYNMTISNFNNKKLLEYYLYLVNEHEKEINETNNLEKEVSELKGKYLNMKKTEINNNKGNIKDKLNYFENNDSTISVGKIGPIARYKNDLKFFENLIIKMNDEFKNI